MTTYKTLSHLRQSFVSNGSFSLFAAATPTSAAITQTAAKPELPTLYVVGDATARSDAPLRGWGSGIGAFFDPTKINVINRAIGGRSTRTFITDGRWDKLLAEFKPGDYVLVQFGHNDSGDYHDPKAKGRPSIRSEGEETAEAIKSDLKTMETIHTFGGNTLSRLRAFQPLERRYDDNQNDTGGHQG